MKNDELRLRARNVLFFFDRSTLAHLFTDEEKASLVALNKAVQEAEEKEAQDPEQIDFAEFHRRIAALEAAQSETENQNLPAEIAELKGEIERLERRIDTE